MAVGLLLTAAIKLCYPLCEDKIDLPHRSEMVPILTGSGQHQTFPFQQLSVSMGPAGAVRTRLLSEGELKPRVEHLCPSSCLARPPWSATMRQS